MSKYFNIFLILTFAALVHSRIFTSTTIYQNNIFGHLNGEKQIGILPQSPKSKTQFTLLKNNQVILGPLSNFKIQFRKSEIGNNFFPISIVDAETSESVIVDDEELQFMLWEASENVNHVLLYKLMSSHHSFIRTLLESNNHDLYNILPDAINLAVTFQNMDVIDGIFSYPKIVDDLDSNILNDGYIFKMSQFSEILITILVNDASEPNNPMKHHLCELLSSDLWQNVLLSRIRKVDSKQTQFLLSDVNIMNKISQSSIKKIINQILASNEHRFIKLLGLPTIIERISFIEILDILYTLLGNFEQSPESVLALLSNKQIVAKITLENYIAIIQKIMDIKHYRTRINRWILDENVISKIPGSFWNDINQKLFNEKRYTDLLSLYSSRKFINLSSDEMLRAFVLESINHPELWTPNLVILLLDRRTINIIDGLDFANMLSRLSNNPDFYNDSALECLVTIPEIITKVPDSILKEILINILLNPKVNSSLLKLISNEFLVSKFEISEIEQLLENLMNSEKYVAVIELLKNPSVSAILSNSFYSEILLKCLDNPEQNAPIILILTQFKEPKLSTDQMRLLFSTLLENPTDSVIIAELISSILKSWSNLQLYNPNINEIIYSILRNPIINFEIILAMKQNTNLKVSSDQWTKILSIYMDSKNSQDLFLNLILDNSIVEQISDTNLKNILISILDYPKMTEIMSASHIQDRIKGHDWDTLLSFDYYKERETNLPNGKNIYTLDKVKTHDYKKSHRIEYKKIEMKDSKGNLKYFYQPAKKYVFDRQKNNRIQNSLSQGLSNRNLKSMHFGTRNRLL